MIRNFQNERQLVQRIEREYSEMPGLRLTEGQAQRLWDLDADTCHIWAVCMCFRATTWGRRRDWRGGLVGRVRWTMPGSAKRSRHGDRTRDSCTFTCCSMACRTLERWRPWPDVS